MGREAVQWVRCDRMWKLNKEDCNFMLGTTPFCINGCMPFLCTFCLILEIYRLFFYTFFWVYRRINYVVCFPDNVTNWWGEKCTLWYQVCLCTVWQRKIDHIIVVFGWCLEKCTLVMWQCLHLVMHKLLGYTGKKKYFYVMRTHFQMGKT